MITFFFSWVSLGLFGLLPPEVLGPGSAPSPGVFLRVETKQAHSRGVPTSVIVPGEHSTAATARRPLLRAPPTYLRPGTRNEAERQAAAATAIGTDQT